MYKSGVPIRLVGVRVDSLTEKGKGQISLFEVGNNDKKQEKIDKAIDSLKDRFGYNIVIRAGELSVTEVVKDKKR